MTNRIYKIITKNGMRIAIIKNDNQIEITEVNDKNERIFGMSIELYKPLHLEKNEKNTKYQISWSSHGLSDIEQGINFMTLLQIAIKLANKENKKIK